MNREKAKALLQALVAFVDRVAAGYEVFWCAAFLPMLLIAFLAFGMVFLGLSSYAGPLALCSGIGVVVFINWAAWLKGGEK